LPITLSLLIPLVGALVAGRPELDARIAKRPEWIRIGGNEFPLYSYPLEENNADQPQGLRRNPYGPRFFEGRPVPGCARGYVGTWTLAKDVLYLTTVTDCREKDTLDLPARVPEYRNGGVIAFWFTGAIRIPTGSPIGPDTGVFPPSAVEYHLVSAQEQRIR
jgi:hypothetical protein